MAVETILDNDTATLTYHPDSKVVHHEFHKFVHGEQFRDVLTKGMAVMQKNHAAKWLSDDRGNSALGAEDAEWAQTVWFPGVKAAGWKHWAVVMPEKVVGQLNMKQWVNTYKALGINSQVFSDPVAAMTWLVAQP
jgi:hypothetical protein